VLQAAVGAVAEHFVQEVVAVGTDVTAVPAAAAGVPDRLADGQFPARRCHHGAGQKIKLTMSPFQKFQRPSALVADLKTRIFQHANQAVHTALLAHAGQQSWQPAADANVQILIGKSIDDLSDDPDFSAFQILPRAGAHLVPGEQPDGLRNQQRVPHILVPEYALYPVRVAAAEFHKAFDRRVAGRYDGRLRDAMGRYGSHGRRCHRRQIGKRRQSVEECIRDRVLGRDLLVLFSRPFHQSPLQDAPVRPLQPQGEGRADSGQHHRQPQDLRPRQRRPQPHHQLHRTGADGVAHTVKADIDYRLHRALVRGRNRGVKELVAGPEQRPAQDHFHRAHSDHQRVDRNQQRHRGAQPHGHRQAGDRFGNTQPLHRVPRHEGLQKERQHLAGGVVEGEIPHQHGPFAHLHRRAQFEQVVEQRRRTSAQQHQRGQLP